MINFLINKLKYKRLLKEKLNSDILGFNDEKYINEIVKTKNNEPVLISYPLDINGEFITVYLFSFVQGKRHYAHMYLDFIDDTMVIADIAVLNKNAFSRGYGSLLLEKALVIARIKNVSLVIGKMAFSSDEQKNRQIHFYSKYGFQIDEKYNLKLIL